MKAEAEGDAGGEPLPRPPDAGVDGRKVRAAAQTVLDHLSQDLLGAPGVERDRMLRCHGAHDAGFPDRLLNRLAELTGLGLAGVAG